MTGVAEQATPPPQADPAPLLQVRDATMVYDSVVALREFSMSVADRPQIVAIAGESGSGKTTLANAILGFTRLTAGEIVFRGRDVTTLKGRSRRALSTEIQGVSQNPYEAYNHVYHVRHVFEVVFRNFDLADSRAQQDEMVREALELASPTRTFSTATPTSSAAGSASG